MNQYDMTLVAVSQKKVKVQAGSAEDAAELVERMYNETDVLDFTDSDVTDISIVGRAESAWGCGCKSCGKMPVFGGQQSQN